MAISSAVISSLHGMKMAALVHPWSVTMSIELHPCDMGSLTMKSRATVSNSIASGFGYIGCSGAFVGCVLTLCLWHSAHLCFFFFLISLVYWSSKLVQSWSLQANNPFVQKTPPTLLNLAFVIYYTDT
jgi:hypothetical protein